MRTLLRHRNVFVPTGNKIRVANALYDLLSNLQPWPSEVQSNIPPPPAQSPQNPSHHQPPTGVPTVTASSPSPRMNSTTKTTSTTPNTGSNNSSYTLQGMFKAYSSEDDKYGGLPTENFARKLSLFSERCDQNCVYDEHRSKAFSIMLKNHALQFYLDSIKGNTMHFDEMCVSVRQRFEPEERTRALIIEWDNLSLPLVIQQNPGNSQTDCLNRMVSRLTDIQTALPAAYHPEVILKNKLLNDVKDVSECQLAYQKPAESIHGVISDLHSALATSATTTANQPTSVENPPLFYAERQIHRPPYNRPSNRTTNYNRFRRRNENDRGRGRDKRCIVCFKQGCWSTNHSPQEIGRADQRNKQIRQFVAEIADDDDDDELDPGLDEFITHIQNNSDTNFNDSQNIKTDQPTNTSSIPGISDNLFLRLANSDDEQSDAAFIASTCNNALLYALTATPPVSNVNFLGIMVDTGAAYSSSGIEHQYYAYCKLMGTTLSIDATKSKSIRYGIGLDDMDRLGLHFQNLSNRLIHEQSGHYATTIRYRGHAYVKWDPYLQTHFTTAEPHRLHRRFGHPSTDKLANFLNRSGLENDPGHTRKTLEAIASRCDPCQRFAQGPRRFKFKLKDNFNFNHTVYADVFYIDKRPILHVVYEATYYKAATWLPSMKAEDLWLALRRCWIDVYIGPPDVITHDAGKNFIARSFQSQSELLHIQTKEVPVETSNSMSVVERYHQPLRRAYSIIKQEAPDTPDDDALQMAVKSVNDSIGPHGLVPTLLVYGTLGLPLDRAHPSLVKRATAVRRATEELSKRYAKRHLKAALSSSHAPNVQPIHEACIGQPVLVYRTNLKAWTGPFRLLEVSGESATVQMPNGKSVFHTTHVKPYNIEQLSFDSITPIIDNASAKDVSHLCYAMTHVNHNPNESPFEKSRLKEFNSLMDRGVFCIVPRSEARGYRFYGARFVDDVKKVGTPEAFEKSRLVVQAFSDDANQYMTYAPTVQQISHRLLLCLAPCDKSLLIFLRDITQAYTQSDKSLKRIIFLEPPASLNLGPDKLLRVIKPLYGLPESGLYWFETYHRHHTENLRMKTSVNDMCFLFRGDNIFGDSEIRGATCLQTDDTLNLGTAAFMKMEEELGTKFARKPVKLLKNGASMEFNGATIHLSNGIFSVEQEFHISRLTELRESSHVDKSSFVSQRARGAYISSLSRPDLSSGFVILAQYQDPTLENVHDLNKLIRQAKASNIRLQFSDLDTSTLRVSVFTDASFANNSDLSSQLGFLILLADEEGNENLLHYSSFKSKRIARSALAAELFALSHAYDVASTVILALDEMLNTQLPLKFYTDSKSLFDGIIGISPPTEKRLLIDFSVIRQSYERREIAEVVWMPTNQNAAYPLTKISSKNLHLLINIMTKNKIQVDEKYWVTRVENDGEKLPVISFQIVL